MCKSGDTRPSSVGNDARIGVRPTAFVATPKDEYRTPGNDTKLAPHIRSGRLSPERSRRVTVKRASSLHILRTGIWCYLCLGCGLLFLLLFCFPVRVCQGETFDLYTNSVELSGDGGTGPYHLPHPFLLLGKEEIYLGGVKLTRGEDYTIDYTRGEITFTKALKVDSRAKVSYQFFPFSIEPTYQHRELPLPQEPEGPEPPRPPQKPMPKKADLGQLRILGSRSLGVSFGSAREPSLNQSLRVSINGRLSKDLSLKAALSDEESPLLPEGTTEKLSELDKVFFEISGRDLSATLGDYDYSLSASGFGRVERKLKGALVKGETSWGGLSLAGARSKGEFAVTRLSPVEGKQGPYELRPQGEEEETIVIPGSERVWLDGELLTRGENNDYTIDYSTGEITFTHRRLITRDSRISVDYEYSTNSYPRSLFSTSGSFELLDGRLKLGGTVLREGDEGDSPLGFDLTPDRRQELSQADQEQSWVWIDGGVWVGPGKGSYLLNDSIYEWVGHGRGDYSVSFTRVDTGGSYDFDPELGGYIWVGEGDYTSKLRTPLPSQFSLLDLSAKGELLPGLSLMGEWAGSVQDLNTFSPGGGNWGEGRKLSLSLTRWKGFTLKATHSLLGESFEFPGRFHPIGYEERWEQEPGGRESLKEIQARLSSVPYLDLETRYGELEKGGYESASRQLRAKVGRSFSYLLLNHDGLNTRGSSSIEKRGEGVCGVHRFGRLEPRVTLSQEVLTSAADSGRWYKEMGGEIRVLELGALSASIGSQLRWDEVLNAQGGWMAESRTHTERLGLSLPSWRGASLHLDLSHRERRFTEDLGEDLVFDLVSFRGNYYGSDIYSFETSYDVTAEESSIVEEQFLWVGGGEGDYSRDPETGDYYLDENGDYVRVMSPLGEPEPTTKLSAFLRASLSPLDIWSVDGSAYLSEQTREPNRLAIYLLDLSRFQRDETTISGSSVWEIETYLYPGERLSFGARWQRSREADNKIYSRHIKRKKHRGSCHLQAILTSQVGLDSEVYEEGEAESSTEYGEEREEVGRGVSSTLSFRPITPLEFSLGIKGETIRIGEPHHYPGLEDVDISEGELNPRIIYTLSGKGRLETGGRLIQRGTQSHELPSDISSLYPIGLTTQWSLSVSYQLSRYLTSHLTYQGEHSPDRETVHSGGTELRACF